MKKAVKQLRKLLKQNAPGLTGSINGVDFGPAKAKSKGRNE